MERKDQQQTIAAYINQVAQSKLNDSQKRIAIVHAENVSEHYTNAITNKKIMEVSGLTEPTVKRANKALIQKGWIGATPNVGLPTEYRLLFDNLVNGTDNSPKDNEV